jgi:hypothetical protein
VDRLLPPGLRIGHDDVSLDPLVAHRQHRDARLPAVGQRGGDGGQGIAGVEHAGADQVGGEVAVAETEPGRVRAVGGELLLDRPALAVPAPAALLVDAAAERVDDGVQVGADPQPVQRDVVAGVDDGGDLRLRRRSANPTEETSPTGPSGQHHDLHERHRAR